MELVKGIGGNDTSLINATNATIIGYQETEECEENCIAILLLLCAIIIIVSSIIIVSFMTQKRLQKRPANILICNQASTDTFAALVFIPMHLINYQGDLQGFLNCFMIYLSLFNLSIICVDRYLATNKPFIHRRFFTLKNTKKLVCFVWMAPLVITLIPLTWWFADTNMKESLMHGYINFMWCLLFVLVVTMTVLYVLATKGAKRVIKNRKSHSSPTRVSVSQKASMIAKKELRVVHLFGLLLFFFSAAYLPILYINFCHIVGLPKYAPPGMAVAGRYLLMVNSALNPILCIVLAKDYLSTVQEIIVELRRTRSGKHFLFVPTSIHFLRRKKLLKMMRKEPKHFIFPLLWNDLQESAV